MKNLLDRWVMANRPLKPWEAILFVVVAQIPWVSHWLLPREYFDVTLFLVFVVLGSILWIGWSRKKEAKEREVLTEHKRTNQLLEEISKKM